MTTQRGGARRRRRLSITRELRQDTSGASEGKTSGEQFVYRQGTRTIKLAEEIERINALAIPSAWRDVEISRSPSAKVLARGVDAAGRVQTIYHPSFRGRQDRLKFDRMQRFGRALPKLRARVDRDLRRRRLVRERVVACVVRLIDLQLFRVGSSRYAKQHRSYGVTTLRDEHLKASPGSEIVEFDFMGKSGKRQQRRMRDARMARLLSQLLELPGHDVFRFFDEDHVVHRVRSRHVNAYIKRYMGEEFTAKDFRTWGGTVLVTAALLEVADPGADDRARAAAVRSAIQLASERLGNTAAVTRSSYVDPRVLDAASDPQLLVRVRAMKLRPARYLSADEQCTLKLLKSSAT